MSLKVRDFYNYLHSLAPLHLAEPQDNNGLQIGSFEAPVSGILLALDVNKKIIEYALDRNLNLIITHHPLIFKPLTSIVKEDLKGELIYLLIKNDLNLLSWHTPLDKIREGVSEAFLRALNLQGEDFILKEEKNGEQFGLGRVVYLKNSIKLQDLAKRIAKLTQSWVMMVGDPEHQIEAFGFCGGSGAFLKDHLKKLGVSTLITSEVKYHMAKDSIEEGFNFIILDHGISETFLLDMLKEKLQEFLEAHNLQLSVDLYKEESPYKVFTP